MTTRSDHGGEPLGWSPVPPKRSTSQQVIRRVLITFGVLALAYVALSVLAIVGMSGGLRWPFTSAPTQTDKEVVAANEAGNLPRDALVSTLQAAGAAAGLSPVTSNTPKLTCHIGRHDWKRNDSFDLQCSTSVVVVLGATNPRSPALDTQLLAFHDQLAANGWKSSWSDTELKSIKDLVDQGRPGSVLGHRGGARYFHGDGERGGQGSSIVTVDFTPDEGPYLLKPRGSAYVEGGLNPDWDASAYLKGGNRYLVYMRLSYVSFSG